MVVIVIMNCAVLCAEVRKERVSGHTNRDLRNRIWIYCCSLPTFLWFYLEISKKIAITFLHCHYFITVKCFTMHTSTVSWRKRDTVPTPTTIFWIKLSGIYSLPPRFHMFWLEISCSLKLGTMELASKLHKWSELPDIYHSSLKIKMILRNVKQWRITWKQM